MAVLSEIVTKTIQVDLSRREYWLVMDALEERNTQLQKLDPAGDWDELYELRETWKDFNVSMSM